MTAARLGRQSMALGLVVLVLAAHVSRSHAAVQLRIGYASPSVNVSMLWITQEAKLFAKNGLEVEVLFLESALVQRSKKSRRQKRKS